MPDAVRVIAVASGKGGVGKTNVSVNLAAALALAGQRVMLMDADLGLANVDVLLGLEPSFDLQHVIAGEKNLDDIIIEGPLGIHVVPASSGIERMAELTSVEHGSLISAFSELKQPIDVLLVDTAAGIADGVVSFAKACQEVVVVVCDEPTSLTDAYALIKVLSMRHGIKQFQILANMVRDESQGMNLYEKLLNTTDRFLEVGLKYLGTVPFDEQLRRAVQSQKAVVDAYPRSPASKALVKISEKISRWPMPDQANGYLQFFVERLLAASASATNAPPAEAESPCMRPPFTPVNRNCSKTKKLRSISPWLSGLPYIYSRACRAPLNSMIFSNRGSWVCSALFAAFLRIKAPVLKPTLGFALKVRCWMSFESCPGHQDLSMKKRVGYQAQFGKSRLAMVGKRPIKTLQVSLAYR